MKKIILAVVLSLCLCSCSAQKSGTCEQGSCGGKKESCGSSKCSAKSDCNCKHKEKSSCSN